MSTDDTDGAVWQVGKAIALFGLIGEGVLGDKSLFWGWHGKRAELANEN